MRPHWTDGRTDGVIEMQLSGNGSVTIRDSKNCAGAAAARTTRSHPEHLGLSAVEAKSGRGQSTAFVICLCKAGLRGKKLAQKIHVFLFWYYYRPT